MYELEIAIISLILSTVSVIFVVFKEGIGMALGFRESEETVNRRKEINQSLNEEFKKVVTDFLEKTRSKEEIDDELKDAIEDLAEKKVNSELANELLEGITNYSKMFLRNMGFSVMIVFILVLYLFLYSGLIDNVLYYVGGIVLLIVVLTVISATYRPARGYYCLREAFLTLSENPTLDNCQEIDEDLTDRGFPRQPV